MSPSLDHCQGGALALCSRCSDGSSAVFPAGTIYYWEPWIYLSIFMSASVVEEPPNQKRYYRGGREKSPERTSASGAEKVQQMHFMNWMTDNAKQRAGVGIGSAIHSTENLRQQQSSALAYFDTFLVFAVLSVPLVAVVLMMKRSVAQKGAHTAAEQLGSYEPPGKDEAMLHSLRFESGGSYDGSSRLASTSAM